MRYASRLLAVSLVTIAASQVWAQDENTPDAQAVIKPGEVTRLDQDSVAEYGSSKRFEVSITGGSAGSSARKVRHMADCKAGTLTLVAVAMFDGAGRLVKTMVAPPGASDPVAPEKGSPQARWLEEVCGR